ncbi:MAG TPA: hypothetical protein VK158_03740 [Acidobacteriota bacterium]|nr:hypothetical protein [Acidobacteriota bacterium]
MKHRKHRLIDIRLTILAPLNDSDLVEKLHESWRDLAEYDPQHYLVGFACYNARGEFSLATERTREIAFMTRYWPSSHKVNARAAIELYASDIIAEIQAFERQAYKAIPK